ncbi:MAG: glutamine synthetase III [Bacilli bacterium]|nr:glutamine synthetase III [Bacilli bacterium]
MVMKNLLEDYGSHTFNDEVMRERIPRSTYKSFHESLEKGEPLSKETATIIANAMKIWAIEKGATHFTHWFAPLTGSTAGKHDAFLELDGDTPLLEFSGKLLRKGEPDASSFPSGGLRATFEARGYTAWDCTSPAFVKDGSLYIPTLFCSYTGEALDNKTPLLRSCDALNKQAVRLLPLLGMEGVNNVTSYVGSEQEYFLVTEECYQKRLDLKFTGRTLFGASAPKGQELDDHYFGNLKQKVNDFMKELDHELWKFGIPSKTKHNEAAPGQHEIACIYRSVNTTTDNNHLLMELMQDIAKKHGLRCLLHEKPFANINGSGKHNNWSVVTNTNINLFTPGSNPLNNLPFLATLACIVKGVDEYADLLRLSIATAANDHRLGGNEAPPAIMSMFLGEELDKIIDAIIKGKALKSLRKNRFQTGVSVIPDFSKDNTDRNRTSPFAFTGNKFEFRGVGSSQSIAIANTMLNSILAMEMKKMADEIENGRTPLEVIKQFFIEHKRIIFNGDGYSSSWEKIAKEKGLPNRTNTVDSILCLKDKEITNILVELGVLSQIEIDSRYEILLESYCKKIQVEAKTALKMIQNQIYPSCVRYLGDISSSSNNLKLNGIDNTYLINDIKEFSTLLSLMKETTNKLEKVISKAQKEKSDLLKASYIWKDEVLKTMNKLREITDLLETKIDISYWPIPTYTDLLFGLE